MGIDNYGMIIIIHNGNPILTQPAFGFSGAFDGDRVNAGSLETGGSGFSEKHKIRRGFWVEKQQN